MSFSAICAFQKGMSFKQAVQSSSGHFQLGIRSVEHFRVRICDLQNRKNFCDFGLLHFPSSRIRREAAQAGQYPTRENPLYSGFMFPAPIRRTHRPSGLIKQVAGFGMNLPLSRSH
jgi:hypothetical protein